MQTKAFLINGIDGNILAQGVTNEGVMLKFGVGGKYLGKFPIPFNNSNIREIDVVSILNVENQLELGYVINNEFRKYSLYADLEEILQWVNYIDNMVFVGRRTDSEGGIVYNQYIYGFKKGCLNEKRLLEVLRVNE